MLKCGANLPLALHSLSTATPTLASPSPPPKASGTPPPPPHHSHTPTGIDMEWCKRPEVGLLSPDVIVHLSLDPEQVFPTPNISTVCLYCFDCIRNRRQSAAASEARGEMRRMTWRKCINFNE